MEKIEYNAVVGTTEDVVVGVIQNRRRANKKRYDDEFLQVMARLFVENGAGKHIEIADALSIGNIAHAHRLAHNLKSNAGQLRMYRLQKAAGVVENSLVNGENKVTEQQMTTLSKELSDVIEALS